MYIYPITDHKRLPFPERIMESNNAFLAHWFRSLKGYGSVVWSNQRMMSLG